MTAMKASDRAALEAMTSKQLAEIVRFGRMDQTNDLAMRNALRREADEAAAILASRNPGGANLA